MNTNKQTNRILEKIKALEVEKEVHLLMESLIDLKSRREEEYIVWSKTSNLSLIPTTFSIWSLIFFSSFSEYDLRYGSKTSDRAPVNL